MPIKFWAFLSVILLVSLTLAYPLRPNDASAHGEIKVIVDDEEQGPYLFRVGISPSSPRIGNLHLNVLIQAAVGDDPINDGRMTIRASQQGSNLSIGPVSAVNRPESPQVFEADIELSDLGAWELKIETTSELGPATLIVPIDVTEPGGGINPLAWIIIPVVVIIVGALGWSQIQQRKKPTQD